MTYLRELDAALVGPRRARRELVQEAADHLEDATDALVAAGVEPAEARARAEADFGSVDEVAAAFQTTLAVSASRRTSWMLMAVLVVQPFLWDGGLNLASANHGGPTGAWWYAALDPVVELGGSVAIVGALLGVVAAGIGNRWFGAGRSLARATALLALGTTLVLPLTVAVMLAATGSTLTMWALAVVLMVVPLGSAGWSARTTLQAATAGR